MSYLNNEYIKTVKNILDKKKYVLCPLFNKFSYCRPLTLLEQNKLTDMNKFQDIPQDLQDVILCENFNQINDKFKCYNINRKKYKYCYDCNQKIKQAFESKKFRTSAMKYFNSDPEDDEDD